MHATLTVSTSRDDRNIIRLLTIEKPKTSLSKLCDAAASADPIHATQPLVLTFHILGFSFNGAPFPKRKYPPPCHRLRSAPSCSLSLSDGKPLSREIGRQSRSQQHHSPPLHPIILARSPRLLTQLATSTSAPACIKAIATCKTEKGVNKMLDRIRSRFSASAPLSFLSRSVPSLPLYCSTAGKTAFVTRFPFLNS